MHRNEDDVDPAAMLELMREQRRRTQRWTMRNYVLMLVIWAVAWAVGFLAVWSAETTGGSPWPRIPQPVAWTVFGVVILGAIVFSIVAGIRSGAGVRGPSRLSGMLYGWSWSVSMLGAWLLLTALQRAGLPPEAMSLLSPAVFVLLVGVLYLAGGALWRSPAQFALGIVMIATAVGATFAGAPTHYLIYATVGPIAMLVVAVLLARGVISAEETER